LERRKEQIQARHDKKSVAKAPAMTPCYDFAIAQGPDGRTIAHRPDCPVVRHQAEIGEPVCTMFGCQGDLPPEIPRHDCLTGSSSS
jgi:hypothetical protein